MTIEGLSAGDLAALKAVLRARGLRATHVRIAVLAAVRAAPRPISSAEIVRAVPSLAHQRRTAYSCLLALVRVGLVARVAGSARPARFAAPPAA